MSNDDIAAAVLECVGGFANVVNDSLCATRLRITLSEPGRVDRNALQSINGVLGIANRGNNGIEVVFGPNLVRGVFNAFRHLVGPRNEERALRDAVTPQRQQSNFQVSITPETPGMPQGPKPVTFATPPRPAVIEDDDTNTLLGLLDDENALDLEADSETRPHLLVVNGPTVNMMGLGGCDLLRESSFSELLALCHQSAREAGFASCECYQSNHEGDLIDWIQEALDSYEAIVINPGGFAYTSVALLEALRAVEIPAVEVHISQFAEKIGVPLTSYVALGCIESINDMGIEGYRKAIFDLARHLGITPAAPTVELDA